MDDSPPTPDTQGLGKVMAILAWVLALLLLCLFFNQWTNSSNKAAKPQVITKDGTEQTIIKRTDHNQYIAEGSINGKKVTFLLDTGATDIVIPMELAEELKLFHGYESYASTAGGNVKVYQTHIDELIIGHLVLHNLNASISSYLKGDQVLLGMTALKRIEFLQKGDSLILMQIPSLP